jgi:hypothetical protein
VLLTEGNLILDPTVLFVLQVSAREWRMRRCFIYALPRRMGAPLWSSFFPVDERLPQAENAFVIFQTRLFPRRFLCTE